MKKSERIAIQDDLTSKVYDLILNEETTNEERLLLVDFKNKVERGQYFEKAVVDLAESLRLLAVSNLKKKIKLSADVGRFYMEISTTGLFKKNLGWGLIAMSMIYHP